MNTLKIEKRTKEQTDALRKIAANPAIPSGLRNAILNKCGALDTFARKFAKAVNTAHYRHADYDARTEEDMAAQEIGGKRAVFAALKAGRRVDLTMKIKGSQFHTAISKVRTEIRRKNLPYILCDEWYRPGTDRRPYKQYWLIDKQHDGVC